MSVKKRRLIRYGEFTKAVISHIVDSLMAGYEAGMRHNRSYGLLELVDSFGQVFKDIDSSSKKKKTISSRGSSFRETENY